MNTPAQILEETIGKLPQDLKNMIFSGVWRTKIDEISKKYTLNSEQFTLLENEVLLTIIGVQDFEDFISSIQKKLNVSEILFDQILEDVFSKIFDSMVEKIDKTIPNIEPTPMSQTTQPTVKPVTPVVPPIGFQKPISIPSVTPVAPMQAPVGMPPQQPMRPSMTVSAPTPTAPTVPEIRPETVPMVEKGNDVVVRPVPNTQNTVPANLPGIEIPPHKPEIKMGLPPELKPIPKPIAPVFVAPKAPQSLADQKLNKVTPSIPNDTITKAPASYTKDPYREPIE